MRTVYTLLLVLAAAASVHAVDGELSVRDFGAVGDGRTDDTAAIQKALDAAKAGPKGSCVVLRAATYRVTATLTVENALFKGLDAGGWPADRAPLPTIIVDHTNGPCIHAKDAASIHGIDFEYDHKGEAARKFGPTILLSGIGISITNLRIAQPYEGIIADGVTNLGRLNIENVFIVSARECGVYVTNTLDIPTLRNIEVWNPADYCQNRCIGFKLGRNDEIRLEGCFAFKCKIGYLFFRDKEGASWGGMTGCSADFSVEGVVVEEAQSLRITGGSFWTHRHGIDVKGPGSVVVCGADIRANADSALVVTNSDSLTVTGCHIGKNGDSWPTVHAARIDGGKSVLISGCTFDDHGPGVVIGDKADHFSITNCVFAPSPFEAITDRSGAAASKMLANNMSRKTSAETPE